MSKVYQNSEGRYTDRIDTRNRIRKNRDQNYNGMGQLKKVWNKGNQLTRQQQRIRKYGKTGHKYWAK